MTSSYFYLRPGSFDLVGFAYGKAEGPATRGGKTKIKLVQSGRWTEEPVQSIELTQDELSPRAVSDEEALDGVGTFVGSAICTSRVRPGGARVLDYGLVVGYKWDATEKKGWLNVNFNGSEIAVLHSPESTEDVAAEVYALQPCAGKSTSLVMASEAKQKHLQIYNMFNRINQAASRDSTSLLAAVGCQPIDESKSVPLLDISSFEVSEMSIRHILDYVFYKEGGQPHPTGASFGDTIFDEEATQNNPPTASRGSEAALSDGLSDSEDEEAGPPARLARSSTKRRRVEATEPANVVQRIPATSTFMDANRHGWIAMWIK